MYDFLFQTPLEKQWKKIGVEKRSGAVFPLFSIHSREGSGIGEFPDLKLAIDWCKITGNSILQVLPLNDTGFQPSPFSAQTSIGLNPLHISLSKLIGAEGTSIHLPIGSRVDYRIGPMKTKALRSIFDKGVDLPDDFDDFTESNRSWLDDFSVFRSLKRHHDERSWKEWEKRYRDGTGVKEFAKNNSNEIAFWKWVQWQAFEQLTDVKKYAETNNILMKGDIPLFVSDDSVDCWANRDQFKMELSTGTPPDNFSKEGQIWGMPPYDWEMMDENIESFQRRLSYAENFYHLFRIDHVVGLFRTWSVKAGSISEKDGSFDPDEPIEQKRRGETILRSLTRDSNMLPCAEDLGTVPDFCRETLERIGIPGLDVGRLQERYRRLAVSTLSTHDMDLFPVWLEKKGMGRENIEKGFEEILSSPSIFSINLIFDWLFFSKEMDAKTASDYRINRPGMNSDLNWSARIPLPMEDLLKSPKNEIIEKAIRHHLRSPGV